MAKNRMAGEEMEKDKNWDARARIFKDDRERADEKLGRIDREKYDLSGHSEEDIFMAMKGSQFDSNDYERLTGKSSGGGNGGGDGEDTTQPVTDPKPEPETEAPGNGGPTQTIEPPGLMPGIPTPGGGSISFSQTQDNDQTITNNGNNNINTQTQDNSNRLSTGGGYAGGAAGFSKDWMNQYFGGM